MRKEFKGVSFDVKASLNRNTQIIKKLVEESYMDGKKGDYLAGTKKPRRTIRSEVKKATIDTLEQARLLVMQKMREYKLEGMSNAEMRAMYAVCSSLEQMKKEA